MKRPPRTNEEWVYWGKNDPLFGVLTTAGRERGGDHPWTLDDVREQGRAYFEEVLVRWRQYGMGGHHCTEIGCGTGRLTAQLAEHFDRVTGVDVSAEQLASARQLLEHELDRVDLFQVTLPQLPLHDSACDGVFSCEVFQHFDSDEPMLEYLRESYRVLLPGGTLCFQVPVRGVAPSTPLASRDRNGVLRIARGIGRRRMMIYRQYDAASVLAYMRVIGFQRTQLLVSDSTTHGGVESYFFATKA